ncbi:hypothetical protein PAMP_011455 [Pampus punctatissimus]
MNVPFYTNRIDDVLLHQDVDLVCINLPPPLTRQIAVKTLGILSLSHYYGIPEATDVTQALLVAAEGTPACLQRHKLTIFLCHNKKSSRSPQCCFECTYGEEKEEGLRTRGSSRYESREASGIFMETCKQVILRTDVLSTQLFKSTLTATNLSGFLGMIDAPLFGSLRRLDASSDTKMSFMALTEAARKEAVELTSRSSKDCRERKMTENEQD